MAERKGHFLFIRHLIKSLQTKHISGLFTLCLITLPQSVRRTLFFFLSILNGGYPVVSTSVILILPTLVLKCILEVAGSQIEVYIFVRIWH